MAGFENDVAVLKNVNFDYTALPPHPGIVTADGQLLIGTTTNPNIAMVANTLTAGSNITITNGPGTITIASTGGGSGNVDSFQMQSGTSPVIPDVNGLVIFNGSTVAAGTNPVRTDGTGANTMQLEVQRSQAIAATDATKVGLSNFNSAQFNVDANAFVSLKGSATNPGILGVHPNATSGTGTDPTIADASGNISILGSTVTAGVNPVRTVATAPNSLTTQVQFSQAQVATDATRVGLASFNSAQFTVDANGFVSSTGAGSTDLHVARFIVSPGPTTDGANYTTITSAITAAVAATGKQTIFLQPGTAGVYTENFTWPENINIVAFAADSQTPNVTIKGTITATSAGTRSMSGIRLETNSGSILSITGSNAVNVNFYGCYFNVLSGTAISSSGTGTINVHHCNGNIGALLTNFYALSAGGIDIRQMILNNSAQSITPDTLTNAAVCGLAHSIYFLPVTTSNTSGLGASYTNFNIPGATLTFNSSGSNILFGCNVTSTTSSAVSIGSGGNATIYNSTINSSNTNAITGLGQLIYNGITLLNSLVINTTTQTANLLTLGKYQAKLQPCFLTGLGTQDSDKTGNGAVYTFGSGNALIEAFDIGNNITTAGVLTAPYDGKWKFDAAFYWLGCTIASASQIAFVASNRTLQVSVTRTASALNYPMYGGATLDFDAGDTMTVQITIAGEAGNTCDLQGVVGNSWIAGTMLN